MKKGDDEDLRWVLHHQKQDNIEIKKQARRYILSILSAIVVLIGIWYSADGLIPSREETAASLTEEGIFWQLNVLSPDYADAFVEAFSGVSAVFNGVGTTLLFFSIAIAYRIEQSSKCEPTGNTEALINKEYETVKEWVRHNDELIESNEARRQVSMDMGKTGLTIVLLGVSLDIALMLTILPYLIILTYSIYYFFHAFSTDGYFKDTYVGKILSSGIIFYLLLRPIHFYQVLTDYSLPSVRYIFLVSICGIIALLYVREDVLRYLTQLYSKLLSVKNIYWP